MPLAIARTRVVSPGGAVVWDTPDSNGKCAGFIAADQEEDGSWKWDRYENQPDGSHKKVDSGTATLSTSDPIVYAWESTTTGHTGTANINSDQSTGTWNDSNAGTSTETKKAS